MERGESIEMLSALGAGDALLFETMVKMTVDTMQYCGLDPRSYFLIRLAGLAAMDASPYSYLLNVAAAADVLEPDDLRGLLIALAPVIGTARTTSAAGNMLRAFASGMDMEQAAALMEHKLEAAQTHGTGKAA